MLSYKNDTKLKDMFVAEVENHRKQDQITQEKSKGVDRL